jgi:Ca2+-binding RTX toxin-like protein
MMDGKHWGYRIDWKRIMNQRISSQVSELRRRRIAAACNMPAAIEFLESRCLLSATTGNLLLNPGAELGTGNDPGTVTDWTVGGTSHPGRDNGAFDDFTPHSGSYDFYGGSGPSGTLTQVVSLNALSSTFLTAIDAGQVSANVQFFEQSLDQGVPSDQATVAVTFQNGSNATLSGGYNSGPIYYFNGWLNVSGQVAVPAGTRSITYQMIFTLQQGTDLDAFVDDNNLSLSIAPSVSVKPQITTPVGMDPTSVASADFNGDGNADLVVANNAAGTVDVLFGNGDGTFKAPVTYSGFNYPHSVIATDLTGDGEPDIVVANRDDLLSILINNGEGTFKAATTVAVPAGISSFPQALAAADLTGNGIEDLVVAGGTSGDGTVSVLMGNGNGTFHSPVVYTLPGGTDNITSVAVADLTGDGKPDIVVTDGDNNTVDVLLNNGTGGFNSATTYPVNSYPVAVAIGDLNGDGKPDLVVAAQDGGANSISVLLNNGNGTFGPASNIAGNYSPTGVALADFNGDGNLDLAVSNGPVGNGASGYTVTILTGNGDGTFASGGAYEVGNLPASVDVADLNGDSKPDLITPNIYDNTISVLLNNAPGTASITISNGTVTANGPNTATTSTISYSGGDVVIDIGGTTESFPISSVQLINVNLGSGLNKLTISNGLPSVSVNGGSGTDFIMDTNSAADTIIGGGGNNTIMGGGAGSLLKGRGGNDFIVAGQLNSGVSAAEAADALQSGPSAIIPLLTSAGHVTARGKGGNNSLVGTGDDKLVGGAGNDFFYDSGFKGDSINGGTTGLHFAQYNPNALMSNIFQVLDPPKGAVGTVSPAVVTGAAVPLTVGPVTDSVNSAGVLNIMGTSASDSITIKTNGTKIKINANGVALTPVLLNDLTGISVKGRTGDDTITVQQSVLLPATISATSGNDSLTGGGGDNVIISGIGNSTLVGGGGLNLLVPGQFETYSNTSPGNDSLVGGNGGMTIADFAYRLDGMVLSNDGNPDSGDPALGEKMTIAPSVTGILAGTGNDTIVGTVANELLSAGQGSNNIHGGGVDDTISASKGTDTVAVAAEPVALFILKSSPDSITGVNSPDEDILSYNAASDTLS